MDYFGEDGPEPIQRRADPEQQRLMEEQQEAVKDRYLRYFMIDFAEQSMRKVASNNIIWCAEKSQLFDNILNEDLTPKQKRTQLRQFENCLGKHTDSLDQAMSALSDHMSRMNRQERTVFEHEGEVNTLLGTTKPVYEVEDRGEQYLLSQRQGGMEPVYDAPVKR